MMFMNVCLAAMHSHLPCDLEPQKDKTSPTKLVKPYWNWPWDPCGCCFVEEFIRCLQTLVQYLIQSRHTRICARKVIETQCLA